MFFLFVDAADEIEAKLKAAIELAVVVFFLFVSGAGPGLEP